METIDKKKLFELHKKLVQTTIDFLNNEQDVINPDDVWSVQFGIDCLDESLKANEWTPFSDSSLYIIDKNRNALYESM